MKKIMCICLLLAMVSGLCACGSVQKPEQIQCGHEAYSDLIARLETGDYDGARSLIDTMQGIPQQDTDVFLETQAPAEQIRVEPVPKPAETLPLQTGETVELTQYNIRDYFEFRDDYLIADQSICSQYVILKEEYHDRLIRAEDVRVEVSYLLCEVYGKVNTKAEEFKSEYFDVTGNERQSKTVQIDRNHMGMVAQSTYASRKGCFRDFAMDVEIVSGSGKLILTEE